MPEKSSPTDLLAVLSKLSELIGDFNKVDFNLIEVDFSVIGSDVTKLGEDFAKALNDLHAQIPTQAKK
jgi:hypothetical protein